MRLRLWRVYGLWIPMGLTWVHWFLVGAYKKLCNKFQNINHHPIIVTTLHYTFTFHSHSLIWFGIVLVFTLVLYYNDNTLFVILCLSIHFTFLHYLISSYISWRDMVLWSIGSDGGLIREIVGYHLAVAWETSLYIHCLPIFNRYTSWVKLNKIDTIFVSFIHKWLLLLLNIKWIMLT